MRPVVAFAVASMLVAPACASSQNYAQRPARPADCEVAVFEEAPARAFDVVGKRTVEQLRGMTPQQAGHTLRQEACAAGADAVVLGYPRSVVGDHHYTATVYTAKLIAYAPADGAQATAPAQ